MKWRTIGSFLAQDVICLLDSMLVHFILIQDFMPIFIMVLNSKCFLHTKFLLAQLHHHHYITVIRFSVDCAKVKVGEIGFCGCNLDMQLPCSENQGDCDFQYHCQGGLRCLSNSCPPSLGFDSNTDCCQQTNIGDEDFCTLKYPCGVDEGDCDRNDECINDLVCGLDNCPNSLGASYETDCCESKGKLL